MTNASRSQRALFALLALTLGLSTLLLPTGPTQAVTTQGITGTVTLATGGPGSAIVDVDPVDPTAADLAHGGRWMTEDDGSFTVALPAGQYWVRFMAYGAAPEWWGDSPTREGSTQVTVDNGSLTSLNPVVEEGGTISGTLAQADPEFDNDGLVEILAADSTYPDGYFLMGLGVADENGDYEAINLPTGSYLIHFYTRHDRLEGWWGNATTSQTSTPVTVTAPGEVTGISPTQLVAQGTVSGTLTNAADGKPVEGAWVSLFYRDPEDGRFKQRSGYETYTDAQGAYSIQAPGGTYRIWIFAGSAPVRSEFWNHAPDLAGAQDISIGIGGSAHADAVLEPKAVVNVALPSISGTTRVGKTLTAAAGTWYPASRSLTYQWFRGGSGAIAGAVHRTYVPGPADVGKYLRVRVTGSAVGYDATPVMSQTTAAPIARGLFRLTSEATLTGRLRVGELLRATAPQSQPSATNVRYQWRRNGVAIKGATSATHRLVRADQGKRMSVVITLTRPGYVPVTRIVTRARLVR